MLSTNETKVIDIDPKTYLKKFYSITKKASLHSNLDYYNENVKLITKFMGKTNHLDLPLYTSNTEDLYIWKSDTLIIKATYQLKLEGNTTAVILPVAELIPTNPLLQALFVSPTILRANYSPRIQEINLIISNFFSKSKTIKPFTHIANLHIL